MHPPNRHAIGATPRWGCAPRVVASRDFLSGWVHDRRARRWPLWAVPRRVGIAPGGAATDEPADQLVLAVARSVAPVPVSIAAIGSKVIVVKFAVSVVILSGGEKWLDMVFPFIRRSVFHSGLAGTE